MEPKPIAIKEIKRLQRTRQAWFKILIEYCEFTGEGLCHIPVSINPEPGVMVCNLVNCHLCKEV